VEVLASIAIMTGGLLGIISLQGAAVNANRRAHELTMATNLARRWQERLRRDSYQWNYPNLDSSTSNIGATWYLRTINPAIAGTTNWVIPVQPAGVSGPMESAAFDYLGRDVAVLSSDAFYCVHTRYTTMLADQLLRAEVRVFWPREGGTRQASYAACAPDASVRNRMGQDSTNLRWVYLAQTLERHEP
jgi:type II secretory pathway pseudopilin PulG